MKRKVKVTVKRVGKPPEVTEDIVDIPESRNEPMVAEAESSLEAVSCPESPTASHALVRSNAIFTEALCEVTELEPFDKPIKPVREPRQPLSFLKRKEMPVAQAPKIKRIGKSSWVWVVLGSLMGIVGAGVGVVWLQNPLNNVLGMLSIACVGGGCFIMYRGFKKVKDSDTAFLVTPSKPLKGPANTCNIIVREVETVINDKIVRTFVPEGIEFVQVENPTGELKQVVNDNNFYHFQWVTRRNGIDEATPAILPDNQSGLNPRDFVIAVMRDNFKAWMQAMNTTGLQKISLWILVGVLGLEIFALIVIGGK